MDKDSKNKILQYESRFTYSRGILRTPQKWQSYFWSYYRDRTNPFLKRRSFDLRSFVVTFSHPRLSMCIQKFINLFDERLSKSCFAGLINIDTAEKYI